VDTSLFLEIECIKKMAPGELEAFKTILNHYESKLSDRIVIDGSAFTPHDLNHCLSIYKIISNYIFNNLTVYNAEIGLTRRELFILNLAVLFHDISMSDVVDVERGNHSLKSAEYVKEEYDDTKSVLRSKSTLTNSECKALCEIIRAHSDVKGDPEIPVNENGLNNSKLRIKRKDTVGKNIRMLFLAGVLRLADELDVSNERLGHEYIENQLEQIEKKYEEMLERKDSERNTKIVSLNESKKHWSRLHLFESIDLDSSNSEILLVVDDDYIEQRISEGETARSLANTISEVYSKIKKEFDDISQKAFSNKDDKIYISIVRLGIKTEIKEIEKEFNNAQSRLSLNYDEKNIEQQEKVEICRHSNDKDKLEVPTLIDLTLEKKISDEINNRRLLQFGHFRLNEQYCARDWINVRELVETRTISNEIVSTIIKHINTRDVKNVMILGLDMVGALLASRVGFQLQLPVSYFVSKENTEYNAKQDLDLQLLKDKKVIIVTESIATFNTMNEAIKRYDLTDKVDSIYTVLYRYPAALQGKDLINEYKVFSLNNSFPIEVVEKSNCIYKEKLCYGKNSR